MTDSFNRNIWISLAGHVFVVMLVFVRAVFIPSEPLEITRSIRVDIVDLPKKMDPNIDLSEPAAPAPPPTPAPKVKEAAPEKPPEPVKPEAPKVNLDAKKKPDKKVDHTKKQQKAMDELKRRAALEKIMKDVGDSKAKPTDKPAAQPIAGNQINAGNALTGLAKLDNNAYISKVDSKIRGNWSLPEWLNSSNFRAQVQILVDDRGYVIKKTFVKSSGNEAFDAAVLDTIEKSSPFEPPPSSLKGRLATSGILLRFPE